ncbi:MAG: imidazole glycerol phosphate synthase subunit HisH [Elusimicrobia bacterium]|nr:imidazole glycerol phosphate synthase subunit HisH [Elusimicrobiota bacterium]
MPRKKPVVVVDYGLGNLFSIARALQALGAEAVLSADPKVVSAADRIILPGVGSFGDGMKGLNENGLVEPIREFGRSGRPLLGICLGMQLLMDEGTEFGFHQGLGLVSGRTVALPRPSDRKAKIPHVGWNLVRPAGRSGRPARAWAGTVLEGLSEASYFYFTHSYVVVPEDRKQALGDTEYAGAVFCSVVRSGNISGCQFHPEKSGHPGLQVLRNFVVDR